MKKFRRLCVTIACLCALAAFVKHRDVKAAGRPRETVVDTYRVLAPIESGNLLLFPVVKAYNDVPDSTPFLTLDEGIKSGQVEVTEAGRVRGLVRPRGGEPTFHDDRYRGDPSVVEERHRGDEVNTLVLVNHSKQPLLLLAGEIVTGGKQDRVIAKDRIVAAESDPIDLSVFCIEPGRWTESSPTFGATAKAASHSFMVQPAVREQAMVAKDQQQVWDSVKGSISQMEIAAAPPASTGLAVNGEFPGSPSHSRSIGTTSYAKAMQNGAVSNKVDQAAAPVMKSQEKLLAQLRQEHAIGVVVAVRGEIVWADLFADTDLLARYWTKLVRSYAAESLTAGEVRTTPRLTDAQRFLNAPSGGVETSEGEVGIYRYSELNTGDTETFVLESLLPATAYEVHISKLKRRTTERRTEPQDYHY